MRIPLLLVVSLLCSGQAFSQGVPQADSIEVSQLLRRIFAAIQRADTIELTKITAPRFHCPFCGSAADSTFRSGWVDRSVFLRDFLPSFAASDLWRRVVKAGRGEYFTEPVHNWEFSELTVFYVTWKPNELAKGHEGAQCGLSFKKIDGHYRFSGIETVP